MELDPAMNFSPLKISSNGGDQRGSSSKVSSSALQAISSGYHSSFFYYGSCSGDESLLLGCPEITEMLALDPFCNFPPELFPFAAIKERSIMANDHPAKKLKLPKVEKETEAQTLSAVESRPNSEFHFGDRGEDPFVKLCSSSLFYRLPGLVEKPAFISPWLAKKANPSPRVTAQNELARIRRKNISDKIRNLEKLMPWKKRMDTATMLEEAAKYVKYLEAQVGTLRWMPVESHVDIKKNGEKSNGSEKAVVSRQEMLQVMVNSALVQQIMYENGWCVFSSEQMEVLNMVTSQREQMISFFR